VCLVKQSCVWKPRHGSLVCIVLAWLFKPRQDSTHQWFYTIYQWPTNMCTYDKQNFQLQQLRTPKKTRLKHYTWHGTGAPLPPRLAAPLRRPPYFSHGPPTALHMPILVENYNRQHTSPSGITPLYSDPRNLQTPPPTDTMQTPRGTGIERISSNSQAWRLLSKSTTQKTHWKHDVISHAYWAAPYLRREILLTQSGPPYPFTPQQPSSL
jgi:hypothetical protein